MTLPTLAKYRPLILATAIIAASSSATMGQGDVIGFEVEGENGTSQSIDLTAPAPVAPVLPPGFKPVEAPKADISKPAEEKGPQNKKVSGSKNRAAKVNTSAKAEDAVPAPAPVEKKVPAVSAPVAKSEPSMIETARRATPARSSYWLDNQSLNDLFQFLAREARLQYFQNSKLDGVKITGELFKKSTPLESMREIALQNNLLIYTKGNTVYALDEEQLAALPQVEFRYELKYLRLRPSMDLNATPGKAPGDNSSVQDVLNNMLSGFLTGGGRPVGQGGGGNTKERRGYAYLEDKVNTIVVVDNEPTIQRIKEHLVSIDKPKRQIAISARILSISTAYGKRVGVDWSSTLGKNGLSLSAAAQANLTSAFGFTDIAAHIVGGGDAIPSPGGAEGGNSSVVLGPIAVNAVLRAIQDKARVTQESAPTVITEDNEPTLMSLVQRVPIVTTTVTGSGDDSVSTSEVRYKIDESDPTNAEGGVSREIGTQMYVIPTILPDNTIRLVLKPRVATQVGTQSVSSGPRANPTVNEYPIVNEATISNVARVPNGYSLILGGFYTTSNKQEANKVPLLGDIPLFGKMFRSKSTSRERNNTVFIITPTTYEPSSPESTTVMSERVRRAHVVDAAAPYPDSEQPGVNADPSLGRQFTSHFKRDEVDTNLLSEQNPDNQNLVPIVTEAEVHQKSIQERYRRATPAR